MNMIQRYARNERGRDLAVGDIHGYFVRLQKLLDDIDFNPREDRLFSVGDIVDRGPQSGDVLSWISKPWFHAVRGNHDDYAVRYRTVDVQNWIANGGGWFFALAPEQQEAIASGLACLPLVIEVETADGIVGILHADCPVSDWHKLDLSRRRARDFCMWSRDRIEEQHTGGVGGVRAVVCGHTPLIEPVVLGNVYHIDTGGWLPEGKFTLLNLETLEFEA